LNHRNRSVSLHRNLVCHHCAKIRNGNPTTPKLRFASRQIFHQQAIIEEISKRWLADVSNNRSRL
jgi:hypothetical protein